MKNHTISICGAIAVKAPSGLPLAGVRERLAQGPVHVDFLDMDTGQILTVPMIPSPAAAPARSHPGPRRSPG